MPFLFSFIFIFIPSFWWMFGLISFIIFLFWCVFLPPTDLKLNFKLTIIFHFLTWLISLYFSCYFFLCNFIKSGSLQFILLLFYFFSLKHGRIELNCFHSHTFTRVLRTHKKNYLIMNYKTHACTTRVR